MKSRLLLPKLAASVFITGTLFADPTPAPQPQVSFTNGTASTWNADWTGVAQRTYFVQWSLDLVSWHYAPVVEFGTGAKSYGIDTENAPKFFLRLKYADEAWVTTLQQARDADFDGDGIPNAFEVETVGSDPLDKASAGGDADSDGMADGWELYFFGATNIANPGTIQSGDGLTNKEKSELGLDPNVNYSAPTAVQKAKYTHNNAGRLTGVTAAVGTASFTPDEEGNITNAH